MFSCYTEKLHKGLLKRIFAEQTALGHLKQRLHVRGRVLWLHTKPVGGLDVTRSYGHSTSFTIWPWSLPSTDIRLAHTTETTWGITLVESYLLWALVIISYCSQERMCFFTRTNCSPNIEQKPQVGKRFYSLSEAAAGQSRTEARFDLGELPYSRRDCGKKAYLTDLPPSQH